MEDEPPVANRLRKLFNACSTILQQDLKRKHGGQKESITSLDDDELVRRRKDMRILLSPHETQGTPGARILHRPGRVQNVPEKPPDLPPP